MGATPEVDGLRRLRLQREHFPHGRGSRGRFVLGYRLRLGDKEDGSVDSASVTLGFVVQEKIQVRLAGDLQCFVVNGTSALSGEYDVMATSTGGGSSSTTQSNSLKPEVKEGSGAWEDWNTFATRNSDAHISFSISPEGSGMEVSAVAYDTVYVQGTPQTPGTYYITATVTSGARTQKSSPVEMRIYSDDQTLQQRMDDCCRGNQLLGYGTVRDFRNGQCGCARWAA